MPHLTRHYDLLSSIAPGKHGAILTDTHHSATTASTRVKNIIIWRRELGERKETSLCNASIYCTMWVLKKIQV